MDIITLNCVDITLNCCREVKEGRTDWLRFRCRAALLSVVSEMLRDIPNPGPDLLDVKGSEMWDWWWGLFRILGNSGSIGEVGVGGGFV